MAGNNKNTFSGSDKNITLAMSNAKVESGETWAVAGDTGAVLVGGVQVWGILNVEAGTVWKGGGTGFRTYPGGTINMVGSSISKITLTTVEDDAIGGDSWGDGTTVAQAGNAGTVIYAPNGGTISLSYVDVLYANTGFEINNAQLSMDHVNIDSVGDWAGSSSWYSDVDLRNVVVSDAANGFSFKDYTKAIVRGSMNNVSGRYIEGCGWGGYCHVDAAYVDWGAAEGPFNTANDKVCGHVSVSPWKHGSSAYNATLFSVLECGGGAPSRQVQLEGAKSYYYSRVANRQIDCSNGFQDACSAINNAFACLGGAINLAASTSPIPVTYTPPTTTTDTITSETENATSSYIVAIESPSPAAFDTSVALGLINVAGLYNALSDAYNSCTP